MGKVKPLVYALAAQKKGGTASRHFLALHRGKGKKRERDVGRGV